MFLSPPEDSDVRTFCMFKVNMSSNANCSLLRLVPEEGYVNSVSESQLHISTNSRSDCGDYLEIADRKICLSDLARPDALPLIHDTSFVAIFWTDATRDTDTATTRPFEIRAECAVYN